MRDVIQSLTVFVLSCLLLVGCDAVDEYIPTRKEKPSAEERDRAARQQREEAAKKEEGERSAFKRHVEAAIKALQSSSDSCERKVAEAKDDRSALSARIRELSASSGDDGRTPDRPGVLAALLADDQVNELSLKYMDRDFRMVRLEFVEAMRMAKGNERAKADALARNREEYDKSLVGIKTDADRIVAAAAKSRENLRKTMETLGKREKELQTALSMTPAMSTVRKQKERELREVSDRLRRLHREYDEIRSNRGANDELSRSARQSSEKVEHAQRILERADAHVKRSFADYKAPKEITSAVEDETIGELERRIVAAGRTSEDGKAAAGECIAYLKSIVADLESVNPSALRQMRADVDRRVSAVGASLGR